MKYYIRVWARVSFQLLRFDKLMSVNNILKLKYNQWRQIVKWVEPCLLRSLWMCEGTRTMAKISPKVQCYFASSFNRVFPSATFNLPCHLKLIMLLQQGLCSCIQYSTLPWIFWADYIYYLGAEKGSKSSLLYKPSCFPNDILDIKHVYTHEWCEYILIVR